MKKDILMGSDHGGFKLKIKLKEFLEEANYLCVDVGCYSEKSCDYPGYANEVAEKISKGEYERGILICGTGIGMSIAANKYKNVRATLCYDEFTAKMAREHNDSNILCLGQRTTPKEEAIKILDVWLNAEFSNQERHVRRLGKIK